MPGYGKKFRQAAKNIDREKSYELSEGITLALASSYARFDETVEVAINLGVDPKYSDQMVRGAVSLPHGLGKTVRVVAFCQGDKEAEAKQAGAITAGSDELVEKIKGGWLEFDKAVATPDMMAKVGQIGRLLGPRGMMPNAKTGTVTFDIGKAVEELMAGKVEFKVDKAGVLHAPLGKVSFGQEKILENLKALVEQILRLKPSSAKGTYLKNFTLATTMGPGVRVDINSVRKSLEK